MRLCLVLGLASALTGVGCKSKSESEMLPPLSAEEADTVRRGVELLSKVSADQRIAVVAKALATSETTRLGTLVDALAGLPGQYPDQWASVSANAIAANLAMLEETCQGGGVSTLEAFARADADLRLDLVWNGCKLGDLDLVTRPDVDGANATAVLLAHMAYSHLKAHGSVSDDERTLLVELAKSGRTIRKD
jgi:hypothetical protein